MPLASRLYHSICRPVKESHHEPNVCSARVARALCACHLPCSDCLRPNLVQNGDFSLDTPGTAGAPISWQFSDGEPTAGAYDDVWSKPGSGTYFWLNGDPRQVPTLSQTLTVLSGTVLYVQRRFSLAHRWRTRRDLRGQTAQFV